MLELDLVELGVAIITGAVGAVIGVWLGMRSLGREIDRRFDELDGKP